MTASNSSRWASANHPKSESSRQAERTCASWVFVAFLGTSALLAVVEAAAVTVGRPLGTALVGLPLQITIPLELAADEGVPCIHAELIQADVSDGSIPWQLEQLPDGSKAIRLSSTALIREPVVTVNLRVGCGPFFERGYVLLAELPPTASELTASPGGQSRETKASGVRAGSRRIFAQSASATGSISAVPESSVAVNSPSPVTPPRRLAARGRAERTPSASADAAHARPRAGGGPRLQLESLDFAIDQAPVLKLSTELGTAPGGGPLDRKDAAALWKELNAPPEQAPERASRAASADVEVLALRDLVQRQGTMLSALSDRFEQVSRERNIINGVLTGALAVLALGLVGLLWLRERESRTADKWWSRPAPSPAETERGEEPKISGPSDSVVSANSDLREPVQAPEAAVVASGPRFRISNLTAVGLLEIHKRAQSLVSLGLHDKAVELMASQIEDHLHPFVWLDLLDLCRQLGRRADYDRVRSRFRLQFATDLPLFDESRDHSEGLESYPQALSRIVSLWPSPEVLLAIEQALFETPSAGSIPFDLDASGDLLLLYGIAAEVVKEPVEIAAVDSSVLPLKGMPPVEPVRLCDREWAPQKGEHG